VHSNGNEPGLRDGWGLRWRSSLLNALSRRRGMVAMVLLSVCTIVAGYEHAVGPLPLTE